MIVFLRKFILLHQILAMRYIFFLSVVFFSVKIWGQEQDTCETCNIQLIDSLRITQLDIDQMEYLKNEILARKGFRFENPHISMHFSEKEWYSPASSNDSIVLNSFENQNVILLNTHIDFLKKQRQKLINSLKILQLFILNHQKERLLSEFNYNFESSEFELLAKTFSMMNFENMHWIGKGARYQISIDNGKNMVVSGVYVVNNQEVGVKYTIQEETTELGKSLYNTDFYIEKTYFWSFYWSGDKLSFKELIVSN